MLEICIVLFQSLKSEFPWPKESSICGKAGISKHKYTKSNKCVCVCVSLSLGELRGSVLCSECYFFLWQSYASCFLWTLSQINQHHMTEQAGAKTLTVSQTIKSNLRLISTVWCVSGLSDWAHVSASIHYIYRCVTLCYIMIYTNCHIKLTLLWWIEARLQAVEELIKAQLPVGVLIRELNEGVDTQAPGKHRYTCKHWINISCSILWRQNIAEKISMQKKG